jgi:hypothetical protein
VKRKFDEVQLLLAEHLASLGFSRVADRATSLKPGEFGLEYLFHPQRKWRFDVAFYVDCSMQIPHTYSYRVGVEIMGGIWTRGGHVRGARYEEDCRKLNSSVLLGWKVLYFSVEMVRKGEASECIGNLIGRGKGQRAQGSGAGT